jgi:hypothetical protein
VIQDNREIKLVNIKRFFDRVSALESRSGRDLVIPIEEARILRDEVAKLLAEIVTNRKPASPESDMVQVEVSGGRW